MSPSPEAVNLFTADFLQLSNDDRFRAISEFVQFQPEESSRNEYKLCWNDAALTAVAAFANTFGGLVIVGIEKGKTDTQAKLVGVDSAAELTTRIASSIATNITPAPSYDIMECHEPNREQRRFCVIRVRHDSSVHLVTKKSIQPVWVRNADETIPADAARLRSMIDRERTVETSMDEVLSTRAHALLEEMVIGTGYMGDNLSWHLGTWRPSETHFKIAMIPREKKHVVLDRSVEQFFLHKVHRSYRRVAGTVGSAAVDAENRSGDFYEYRWYHRELDYEQRWRFTSNAEIAHATQVKYDSDWSVVDLIGNIVVLLRVGSDVWRSLGYFGDGLLYSQLTVGALPVSRGTAGQFLQSFRLFDGDVGLSAETIMLHSRPRSEARAGVAISFWAITGDISGTVTALVNSLLRSLGHSVLWNDFKDDVSTILGR